MASTKQMQERAKARKALERIVLRVIDGTSENDELITSALKNFPAPDKENLAVVSVPMVNLFLPLIRHIAKPGMCMEIAATIHAHIPQTRIVVERVERFEKGVMLGEITDHAWIEWTDKYGDWAYDATLEPRGATTPTHLRTYLGLEKV